MNRLSRGLSKIAEGNKCLVQLKAGGSIIFQATEVINTRFEECVRGVDEFGLDLQLDESDILSVVPLKAKILMNV